MQNKEEILLFLEYLNFEKGMSQNTINAYKNDLKYFFQYKDNKHYNEITEKDVLEYMEIMKKEYKKNTIMRKVSAIKNFFLFLLENEYIKVLPTEYIEKIKNDKYLPETLKVEEIRKLLLTFGNDIKEKRDNLILKVLVATGARISEILGIKIEDIDEKYEFIRVFGKGKKYRNVPIYKELGVEIDRYIKNIRAKLIKPDENTFFLFPNITRQNYWLRLQKYAKRANIEKKVYPHIIRHTIASEMLKNGADIRIIQEVLGHSDISTTEIYTHLDKKSLKKIYDEIGIGDK